MFWAYTILISCIKLLLLPSYKSTDFEVHRNWLAITHNVTIKKWYFEDTSEWTLDYPPLFAWFECILSQFAIFFDPEMLKIDNLNYASEHTVIFQRLSVILTDIVYFYGVKLCITMLGQCKGQRSEIILPILMLANPGLLMVDHIHFQYNGIMYGILLISICKLMQKKHLQGGFFFTVLLCMKHIYVYCAPAYFIYLLTTYCLKINKTEIETSKNVTKTSKNHEIKIKNDVNTLRITQNLGVNMLNCIKLGVIVLGVFFATFLPFYDHIDQLLKRLFPFKRGLCHAYWAPNFWALYNIVDKAAVVIVSKMGLTFNTSPASMTGGLVREYTHSVLPNITPLMTLLLVGGAMLPAVVKLGKSPQPNNFLRCIVLCSLASFIFGWHVHEKAILMAIIPLSILAVVEPGDTKVYLLLSTVGHFSLFPLLFPANLLFVKLTLVMLHAAFAFYSLHNLHPFQFCQLTLPMLNSVESMYTLGLLPVFVYCEILHRFAPMLRGYPFLPLMTTSVYCALGVCYSFVKYYVYFLVNCK